MNCSSTTAATQGVGRKLISLFIAACLLGAAFATKVYAQGSGPSITSQPVSREVIQGTNVSLTVAAAGTAPLSYQWYLAGYPVANGTGATLTIPNVQPTDGGIYTVVVSNPGGSVTSSNAMLSVDVLPIITGQPQSRSAVAGTNVTLTVVATTSSTNPPAVGSGALQLWLKGDAGLITNGSGLVSQWQDQSGNANHASQANASFRPAVAYSSALGGRPAVRFNNVLNSFQGSFLNGANDVGVPDAMTAFVLYNAFTNYIDPSDFGAEIWFVGTPSSMGSGRAAVLDQGVMDFSVWNSEAYTSWIVPTNTYRIRTDRLDASLDTAEIFDSSLSSSTNFIEAVSNAGPLPPGYYLGGLDQGSFGLENGRGFDGDIAEVLIYQGYLNDSDRSSVTAYLQGKYFAAGSPGRLSYQWQFNGTNIAKATNSSLTLTNVQLANGGAYRVLVTGNAGTAGSTNSLLTVGVPPAITMQPQSRDVGLGTNANFTVTASGSAPLFYQWFFNGVALPGASDSTLVVANVQGNNQGAYSVLVSNLFGSISSSNVALSIDLPPVITTQPQSQVVLAGSNVTFTVAASGSLAVLPPVNSGTMQLWLKGDAGVITNDAGLVSQWQDQSGNFNDAYQFDSDFQPSLVSAAAIGNQAAVRFNSVLDSANGYYLEGFGDVGVPNALTTFIVYNSFSNWLDGADYGSEAWFVGTPVTGGARACVFDQGKMDFSVWNRESFASWIVPTNTYRLRTDRLDTNVDRVEIFDNAAHFATNFSLLVTGAATPDAGYYIGALDASILEDGVSRCFDGDIAEIVIYNGYLNDADRLAVAGYLEQKYALSSSPSLAYQWLFNGTNIPNATNASLTLTNLQPANGGSYTVVVSNQAGVAYSSNAVLTIAVPPYITIQPATQDALPGGNATFTVGVSGTGPFNYQWFFYGSPIAQATASSLTLSSIQNPNLGYYSVAITTPFGAVASSNAFLFFDTQPSFTTQPKGGNAAIGSNFTLSAGVASVLPLYPQVSSGNLRLWLKADAGVVTNASGLVSQWQDQSGYLNHAFQTNLSSQPVLTNPPAIGGRPVVRFTGVLDAVNGAFLHGTGNVGLSNAMTGFLVYNPLTNWINGADFGSEIWFIGSPVTGGARAAVLDQGKMDFSLWNHEFFASLVVPTNTYRIRTDRLNTNLNSVDIFDNSPSGSTNFSVIVGGAATPAAGYFVGGLDPTAPGVGRSRCFNGDVAEIMIYSGSLTEVDRLAVTSYLQQRYAFSNATGLLGNVSYQWRLNGTNIAGATNASLTLTNLQPGQGGPYSLVVSNLAGFIVSSNTFLNIGHLPTLPGAPQNLTVVQGSNATFVVTPGGDSPFGYQWYFGGIAVASATSSSLTVSNVQLANAGNYFVRVTNIFGTASNLVATLTVGLSPSIDVQPQGQTTVSGGNIVLKVSAAPPLPSVGSGSLRLWLKAGAGVVTNSAGLVNQWQDQSGNLNHAAQATTGMQPVLSNSVTLGGLPVVRFNGVLDAVNGNYLHGTGDVGLSNAMTAFVVYNAFTNLVDPVDFGAEIWFVGSPTGTGTARAGCLDQGEMDFSVWNHESFVPWIVPTNTYRIRTDRLNANLDTVEMFDNSAADATNFVEPVASAGVPSPGYYVGALDATIPGLGNGRCFNGDIAELVIYRGYLTDTDRIAVTSYLEQKYFSGNYPSALAYQWQFDGVNIPGATQSTLALNNIQTSEAGTYTVIVKNGNATAVSSNAVVAVNVSPTINAQPLNVTADMRQNVALVVSASGTSPLSYQWRLGGLAIAGATNSVLPISNLVPGDGGTYSVAVSNIFGIARSSNAVLLVNYWMVAPGNSSVQWATTNLTVPAAVRPGNALTVTAVDPVGAAGGSVQLSNNFIVYTPPAAFVGLDSFKYLLTPAIGPAVHEQVTVVVGTSDILGASLGSGQATLRFQGVAGRTFAIQASVDLKSWTVIGSVTAGPDGMFQFQDANAGLYPKRFYRAVLQ